MKLHWTTWTIIAVALAQFAVAVSFDNSPHLREVLGEYRWGQASLFEVAEQLYPVLINSMVWLPLAILIESLSRILSELKRRNQVLANTLVSKGLQT